MKTFFPLLITCALLISCQGGKKKAFEFNQTLAAISDSLQRKGARIGTELAMAVNTRDFNRINSLNNDLLRYIREREDELTGMKDTDGSEAFRNAMLEFLAFEAELVRKGFLPLGKMNQDTPEKEIQDAIAYVIKKSKEESVYLLEVQRAQEEFAKNNGFKIESKNRESKK